MKLIKRIYVISLFLPITAFATNVEVILKSKLDGNLSGYCIDIKGGFANIDPTRGLQAHTCLSYRGDGLAPDQVVDLALVEEGGVFKFEEYDVCATMQDANIGDELTLTACDGSEAQKFIFPANGTISPAANTSACLTVSDETALGRNGAGPHQIKTLTLQNCDTELAAHQQWRTRDSVDENYTQ